MPKDHRAMDGMTAAAYAAYALSEAAVIFPITPASKMSETLERWSVEGRLNAFDQTLQVKEMQSEKGVAGALHGVLSGGALGTTVTDSQGLMLMIPNMYKIAGENLPGVFHVTCRSLAAHALSIFGDHQDIMAVRATGCAMLGSASVQEAMDLSLVAHLSAIQASLPFVHFFDGFRTSDEVATISPIDPAHMVSLLDRDAVARFRARCMEPERPDIRGTAQNPDIYFQNREAANPLYEKVPAIVQANMDAVAKVCGRSYHLFDYVGAPDATRVVVTMASSCDTVEEVVRWMMAQGEKVGLVKVRLYRPFSAEHLMAAIPDFCEVVCALDRTKEPGSQGEPLYQDVALAVLQSGRSMKVMGGRYGLSSKDFDPTQVKAVFDNMAAEKPKVRFTVGITDDVTDTSLPLGPTIHTFPGEARQAILYGFGSDGTVGACKQLARIVGDHTQWYSQDYSWFDGRKSGGLTICYQRFSKAPIRSPYLVDDADVVVCAKSIYLKRNYPLVESLKEGGVLLVNGPWTDAQALEKAMTPRLCRSIARKKVEVYAVDASALAEKLGLGARINMVMETCFASLMDLAPMDQLTAWLKEDVGQVYASKGDKVVAQDRAAIDGALAGLAKIPYPASWADLPDQMAPEPVHGDAVVEKLFWPMERLEGNDLPVSAFDPAGIVATGTTAFEKRTVAENIPIWNPDACVQCYECSFVCPQAAIRPFLATGAELREAPADLASVDAKFPGTEGHRFRIQVFPQDCVGCGSCAHNCPGHALTMEPLADHLDTEKDHLSFLQENVSVKDDLIPATTVAGTQLQEPLLQFGSNCGGCGETPYVKLLTQLFGDRLLIANATGCSSIWGAYSPAMPYAANRHGHGPAWANSLFEDNGEYGYGIHKGVAVRRTHLKDLITREVAAAELPGALLDTMGTWLDVADDPSQAYDLGLAICQGLEDLPEELPSGRHPHRAGDRVQEILAYREMFGKKSVWCVGGDGWAYDIGFGGIDEVLASGEDINMLVLDTEGYSNTGGEMSKATQLGSVSGFALNGKKEPKKDLGQMMTRYGYVYVAHVCFGADMEQTIRALREAEAYPGPSIVIALCPCISWGLRAGMSTVTTAMKEAVAGGYWPLWRFDPRRAEAGKDPLVIDSPTPDTSTLPAFLAGQDRYASLAEREPALSSRLQSELAKGCDHVYQELERLVQAAQAADTHGVAKTVTGEKDAGTAAAKGATDTDAATVTDAANQGAEKDTAANGGRGK